jgi:hypothetical protein
VEFVVIRRKACTKNFWKMSSVSVFQYAFRGTKSEGSLRQPLFNCLRRYRKALMTSAPNILLGHITRPFLIVSLFFFFLGPEK